MLASVNKILEDEIDNGTQPSEFGKKTYSKKMLLHMRIMTAKHKPRRQKCAVMY